MNAKSVVLLGGLSSDLGVETQVFGSTIGEVTFRADVIDDKGVVLRNIPLLRLYVEVSDGDVYVDDEYFRPIPYLKPVRAFREFLMEKLQKLQAADDQPFVVRKGVAQYGRELREFSNTASLVRQAKTQVGNLDVKDRQAEEKSRKVLAVLGRTAWVDTEFSVRRG